MGGCGRLEDGKVYGMDYYCDGGGAASFANSGTGKYANCVLVWEFDDYSARIYSQEAPPRALLVAKGDQPRGTQVCPLAAYWHVPRALILPVSWGGRGGASSSAGTTRQSRSRAAGGCLRIWTCRSPRRLRVASPVPAEQCEYTGHDRTDTATACDTAGAVLGGVRGGQRGSAKR